MVPKVEPGVLSMLWAVLPQHVPGDVVLTPIASKLNNWCSVVCIIMAIAAHFCCDYHETRLAVIDEDPTMPLFLCFSATMAFYGLVFETGLGICIRIMGLQACDEEDLTLRRRLRLNRKMVIEFSLLSTMYTLMACDMQVVHKGWIAEYYGGHQIVYSFRYIEWVCFAPIVLSISGSLDHAPDGSPRNGLMPSSLLTGIYCIISWQALVVTNFYWSWALIIWAFVSFFVASYEQFYFALWVKDQGASGPVRAAMLTYLVVMLGIYGVVYLLPIQGWISATLENKFYCLGDVSFKIGTSVMLLATNDLAIGTEMRRRAEAAADDLQRLIRTASVPILGVDTAGHINQWNMKTEDLTGLSGAEAMGLPLVKMLGESSQAEAQAFVRSALAGDEIGTLETSLYPKGLQELGVASANELRRNKTMLVLSAVPRKDKRGDIKGVSLVGCDLTEVAAYREAEQRKMRFMAVVSHELRSPLYGIIGLLDQLCDTEKQEGPLRTFKLVKTCANRLLDLVMNIMEMATMACTHDGSPAPTKRLSRDPVDLSILLDEVVLLVKCSSDKGGRPLVKTSVQLMNEVNSLPIIEADTHKCTQVFFNLVTNACKFTKEGRITLTGVVDPEKQWVEISVTDTGKGIARGSLERIFLPFEQEDNSAIRGYQGIGLGLSIATELVRAHGGSIKVESELDVGTSFSVRLPIVMPEPVKAKAQGKASREPNTKASPQPASVEAEDKPSVRVANRRPLILSVDNDDVNQQVVQGILSEYEVHIAMDGTEALEFLQKCETLPDTMLLDIAIPGTSGYEVCIDVRGRLNIGLAEMPILMLSASPTNSSIIAAYDSGANSLISKPLRKHLLNAQVRAALRLKADYVAGARQKQADTVEEGALRRRRFSVRGPAIGR
mmetsp:Transcript_173362/g.550362  ORF Transcript_173362/g.550362 Transcript_173362/m.550362 type:complete len:893 (+) Transcript_173362:105-2783(+)